MKQNETDYLDTLFASSSDANDEQEIDIPQRDVSVELNRRLIAISDQDPKRESPQAVAKIFRFPKMISIAASVFVAVFGFQLYQHQQTLKQLDQAQADLATALHYLGQANRIARSQVLNSLNDNIKKAGVEPAVEMGRETTEIIGRWNARENIGNEELL